jgi:ArsR family transcriptional regulator, arsenate/arsenite/antimonite-responsive transcriptional repressor
MRDAIKSFKVLSDETRLRILGLLLERECCVCEVVQALHITQSKASRGLTALCDTGFITLKKDGLWSLYSVNCLDLSPFQTKLIEAAQEMINRGGIFAADKLNLSCAHRAARIQASCPAITNDVKLAAAYDTTK